jgi:hypothetical protein
MNGVNVLKKLHISSRAQTLCLVVVCVFGLAAGILLPTNIFAVENRSIGGNPAYPKAGNPRTQSIFIHTGGPGALLVDGVEVVNNASEAKTIVLYSADYVRSSDGAFACGQKGNVQTKVGAWVRLAETETRLEKNSSKIVGFNIQLPTNIEPGEHNGCIVIEEKNPVPVNGGSGIGLTFRSAIRIAITVPGAIVKGLNIKDFRYMTEEANPDKQRIEAIIENTGNVSLDTNTRIQLVDLFGKERTLLTGVYPILSQNTQTLNAAIPDDIWFGYYHASLKATYDQNSNNVLGVTSNASLNSLDANEVWFVIWPNWKFIAALATSSLLISLLYDKRAFFIDRLRK